MKKFTIVCYRIQRLGQMTQIFHIEARSATLALGHVVIRFPNFLFMAIVPNWHHFA